MEEPRSPLLKHGLGQRSIERVARNLKQASPAFDALGFVAKSLQGLEDLELKQRVIHVAEALAAHLPSSYPKALAILVRAEKTWDGGELGEPHRAFAAWPLLYFIETRGHDHFERSMDALCRLTHLFSAEFAVRPFLQRYPEPALARLSEWCDHPSDHVRRLVSEGTRPRLPWAGRLPAFQKNPEPVLALLDRLKDDPSEYVRRSVANNLNDIGKDHPERVIQVCGRWVKDAPEGRKWVVRHATRSLVKAGHPGVWALLGISEGVAATVSALHARPSRVAAGGEVSLSFCIQSTSPRPQRIAVDFAVHYVKSSGQTRPKVFKLKVLNLGPLESVTLEKRISFRPISTRSYYPGEHRIEVLMSGASYGSASFRLLAGRKDA